MLPIGTGLIITFLAIPIGILGMFGIGLESTVKIANISIKGGYFLIFAFALIALLISFIEAKSVKKNILGLVICFIRHIPHIIFYYIMLKALTLNYKAYWDFLLSGMIIAFLSVIPIAISCGYWGYLYNSNKYSNKIFTTLVFTIVEAILLFLLIKFIAN